MYIKQVVLYYLMFSTDGDWLTEEYGQKIVCNNCLIFTCLSMAQFQYH